MKPDNALEQGSRRRVFDLLTLLGLEYPRSNILKINRLIRYELTAIILIERFIDSLKISKELTISYRYYILDE